MKQATIIVLAVLLVIVSAAYMFEAHTINRMAADRKALVEYIGQQEIDGNIILNGNVRSRLFDFSPEANF